MHDRILDDNGLVPNATELPAIAKDIGLDQSKYQHCVSERVMRNRVAANAALIQELGISGTPTFYFGVTENSDDKIFSPTSKLVGARPYDVFKQLINRLIAG